MVGREEAARVSGAFTRLQVFLQGWPNRSRAQPSVWLGNRVSDFRYWFWRLERGARRLLG